MKKLIVVCLLASCSVQDSTIRNIFDLPKGVVRRVYEVPTYKSYFINYHMVIKDSQGIGEDVEVTQNVAAQYAVGDTIK